MWFALASSTKFACPIEETHDKWLWADHRPLLPSLSALFLWTWLASSVLEWHPDFLLCQHNTHCTFCGFGFRAVKGAVWSGGCSVLSGKKGCHNHNCLCIDCTCATLRKVRRSEQGCRILAARSYRSAWHAELPELQGSLASSPRLLQKGSTP